MNTAICIPARLSSTRLPNKLLQDLNGKPVLQHTYEQAKQSKADYCCILCDDEKILEACQSFGAPCFLTPKSCQNGSSRLAWACQNCEELKNFDCIVNVQGDEPFLPPTVIDTLIDTLKNHPDCDIATPVCKLDEKEADVPSIVKCVFDDGGRALYFSRSKIPANSHGEHRPQYWRHLGLYVYKRELLLRYQNLSDTPLQLTEQLEQLKFLEHQIPIAVAQVTLSHTPIGIDTQEDLEKARNWLCQQSTSS